MRLDWYSKPAHQKILRAELYQVTCLSMFSYVILMLHDLNITLYIYFHFRVLLTQSLLASHAVIELARELCFHVRFLVVTATCRGGS